MTVLETRPLSTSSMMTPISSGPLKGIRILEFPAIGPAPFACMLLADLGADVLRIERPPGTTQHAPYRGTGKYAVLTRGRPALPLDLKSSGDRDRALHLAAAADIVVEGFRPGVMERLGLGPVPCIAANPALVYGRMTGWGQEGPLARTAGHDLNFTAVGGALHAIGPRDGKPVPLLNIVGDFGGGALYLALGVVSAMLEARTSGRGQVVDAAIVDGSLSLMAMVMSSWAAGLWQDKRGSNAIDGGMPWYDTYECADGRYISVSALEPRFYDALCARLGEDLPSAQERSQPQACAHLRKRFTAIFLQRSREEWCAVFEGVDACVAPVLSLAEVASHPHNRARGNVIEIDGVQQPAPAPRFSRTPGAIQSPAGSEPESGGQREQRWLLPRKAPVKD